LPGAGLEARPSFITSLGLSEALGKEKRILGPVVPGAREAALGEEHQEIRDCPLLWVCMTRRRKEEGGEALTRS
jgi:hypothetical protein